MSVSSYKAEFQNERPVGAARIKDIMYIFNGSYPVYYTGDGELYMFPEYQPTFSEQVVAGPNTMMDDFEDYYFNRDFDIVFNTPGDRIEILSADMRPRIPYQIKAPDDNDPQIELQVAYTFKEDEDYNDALFWQFLPPEYEDDVETYANLSGITAPDDNSIYYVRNDETFYRYSEGSTLWSKVIPSRSLGFHTYYEVYPKVYYRNSSIGESDLDWIEIDEENLDYFIRSNRLQGVSDVQTVDGEITMPQSNTIINSTAPYYININGLTAGLKDIKVELYLKRQKYETIPISPDGFISRNVTRLTERVYSFLEYEFDEVEITAEKLKNFPTEEEPTRGGFTLHAPWSCNQVIEHYGKLIAFGSKDQPETAFVSSVENFAYFPYNYTIDFNNDLKEGINSIVPFMNILVVQSDSYTWGLKGSSPQIYIDDLGQDLNPNAYQVITINSSVGSIAPKSVRPVRNRLYFLSQEGLMELTSLFATDDRYNVKPLDRNIKNLIPQDKNATAIQFDNQYWIHFPSTKQTFRYYIDKQAWVKDSFNFNDFNGIHRYYIKDGKLHFVTNPMVIESGNPRLYEGIIDYSLATDFDQPVKSQFLTSKMHQEYPFHWKRYKELKLDFSIQNEYMPNRAPLELTSVSQEIESGLVEVVFSAPLIRNHAYTVAFNIEVPDEAAVEVNDFLPENVSVKDGMIRFIVGNDVPESIVVRFPDDSYSIEDIQGFTVVDDTYDPGLLYDLRIMADNETMIRDDYKNYAPVEKNIDTGTAFSNITFGNTNFGDVTTFVQTTKLYGNGYDINVYYKDESNIKWTLETMGVTYKMRRTRSDRRG